MTDEEKRLVQRFRSGEECAFDEIYADMGPRIYRFALRLTRCVEDAEDAVVQTFSAAHSAKSTFDHRSSLATWLYRIAVFQVSRIQRTRRQTTTPVEDVIDESAQDGFHQVELELLLMDLPAQICAAFLLVRLEGLSYREAAQVLDKRPGTIQAQVHEASLRLRKQLRGEEGAPQPIGGLSK
jgi:RNA polymerase sigma-70 factor (ECF subfamily)